MQKFITVKYRIPGFHQWPGAPDQHAYLRDLHRHEFHFTVWLEVFHDDRDIEFIALKKELTEYTQEAMSEFATSFSCEMLGKSILQYLADTYGKRDAKVWVEEDGENGGYLANE